MKKHWFKLTLLSLALILSVVVWGLLDTLWASMEEFEAASEIGAVTEYFNNFKEGNYDTAAATSGFIFDEKNSKQHYVQYLKDTFGADFSDLRFAGQDADEKGEKLYRIYAGSDLLGSVRLIPTQGQARNWNVTAEVEYADTITVTAPAFVRVYANDALQTPDENSAKTHTDFTAVEKNVQAPQTVTYTLQNYLYAPSLTATAPDGTACTKTQANDRTVEFTVPVAESDRAKFEQLMTDFSKLYANYVSKDASFKMLKPKMLKGTDFYESVRTFYNGWYIDHSGYEFRDLTISDMIRPDENTFVGNIKFDYVVFRGTKEYVYPSAYRLSFVLSDGTWLLADMKIK